MKDSYKKIIDTLGQNRVLTNEPLSKYSTFSLGGPADLFYKALTTAELVKAITTVRACEIPFFIMGGGTNLLIGDKGFRGLVIKNETKSIKLVGAWGKFNSRNTDKSTRVNTVYIEVDSGVGVNRLVRFTLDQGFSGLEPFLGQPGSVGGAVYINAHNMHLGKFIGEKVFSAKILKPANEVANVPFSYFKFGYDKSVLQKTGEIVLSVIFKLAAGDKNSLWEKAQEEFDYRRKTQPAGVYTSGCTFRNISESEAVRIATPNYTKSAGYLIESVGLKNYQIGGAKFSQEHANFIVHSGGATASNVLELIRKAQKSIKDKYAINLVEEIVLVGEF